MVITKCFNQVHFEHPFSYRGTKRPRHVSSTVVVVVAETNSHWSVSTTSTSRIGMVGDAKGEYYGESAGSYMVQEFK
jgi:hypothetical protein